MGALQKYSHSKSKEVQKKKLTVSYKFVEHANDYFFLHGLSKEYYEHLTDTLEKLQSITETNLRQQKDDYGLTPKAINFTGSSTITHKNFPIDKSSKIYGYIKARTREETGSDDDTTVKENIKEFTKNAFEIRLSTNYGRIHGFVYQDVFYIIWFDPAHNLFLSKHQGKTTKLELPHDVQKLKPICPTTYQEYNTKLTDVECCVYELLDTQTS